MNLFDLAHSVLTGQWKIDRDRFREERAFLNRTRSVRDAMIANHEARARYYAGAEPGSKRQHPNQLTTPEDYKLAFERIVLIRAARQMEEDQGFFDGLLDDFETYVVGPELLYFPNTGNPEADRVLREYLEWKLDRIDYSERLSLTKIAQLMVRSMKRDGECALVPYETREELKVRYISGDCIGNPTIGTPADPYDFNGILVSPETLAPIEFQIFARRPKVNSYTFERAVAPWNFFHYTDPFRFQQYHGVTVFKTAIRDGFDIDEVLELSKLNMKWRAAQLPTIHSETGRPRGAQFGYGNAPAPVTTPSGDPAPLNVDVNGVVATFMKTGESVVDYPNDFPNAQLKVTVEELRRQCCKGAKLPYEFVYQSGEGGVVQRFWADKARNTFERDKAWLRRVALTPTKNRVIEKGLKTGELDLNRFGNLANSPERFRGQWQMGRPISVDYGRETDADIKLIEAGLLSPQDKAAEDGRSLEEVRMEIKSHAIAVLEDAKAVAAKTGFPVEQVLPFLLKKWPNPDPSLAKNPEPAGTPVPAGALGEKD